MPYQVLHYQESPAPANLFVDGVLFRQGTTDYTSPSPGSAMVIVTAKRLLNKVIKLNAENSYFAIWQNGVLRSDLMPND